MEVFKGTQNLVGEKDPKAVTAGQILPASRSLFVANPLQHYSYDPFGSPMNVQQPRQSTNLMKLSVNGRFLALASDIVDLMDVERGRLLRQFTDHTNVITGITSPQNSCHVWATVGADKTLRILDSRKHPGQTLCKRFDCRYQSVCYAPNSEIIFCGGDNICVFDLRAMREVAIIRTESQVLDLECHPEDCLILGCTDDKMVKVWDIDTHECVCQSFPLETQVKKVLFEPSGKVLVACTLRQVYSIEFDPFNVISQIPWSTAKPANNFIVMDGEEVYSPSQNQNFSDVVTLDAVFENGTLFHFGHLPGRNSLELRTVSVEELLTASRPGNLPINTSPDFGRFPSPSGLSSNSAEAESLGSTDVSPMLPYAPPVPADSPDIAFSLKKISRSISSSRNLKTPQMQKKSFSSNKEQGQNRTRSSSTHSLHSTVKRVNSTETKKIENFGKQKNSTGNTITKQPQIPAPKNVAKPPSFPQRPIVDKKQKKPNSTMDLDGFLNSHKATMEIMSKRKMGIKRVKATMKTRNSSEDEVLDEATQLQDKTVLAYLLKKHSKTKSLKFAARILPEVRSLLSNPNPDVVDVALSLLREVGTSLVPLIKQGIASNAQSIGVDVAAEQRQIWAIKSKEYLRRLFEQSIEKLKVQSRRTRDLLQHLATMPKLKKHKFSVGEQQIKDISEIFQQNLLRDVEIHSPFREQYMTIEQLTDIYPLSRINHLKPTKSLGLNDDEAEIRLNGSEERNVICPTAKRGGKLNIFFSQFLNTFRLFLLLATVCCLLIFILDFSRINELGMAIIIFLVLVLMCVISYLEEIKTIKQISGFQSVIPVDTTVLRSGRKIRVNAADLVIGDLVWIKTGDRIPADLRMIHTEELQLETSWLSGEVEPLSYTHESAPEGKGVFESQNVVFSGCSVTSGRGLGVVIRIGNSTVLGNLVEITSKEKLHKSPLEVEHHRFVFLITGTAITVSALTFLLGLFLNGFDHVITTFVNGFLIVFVACVPQGLPVTLTAQLLIVARRLSKNGLYLKRLDLADTLGLTSILMVDKTTVLTKNDLKLTDLWTFKNSITSSELIEIHQRNSTEKPEKSSMKINDSNFNNYISYNLINGIDDITAVMLTVMSICDKAQIQASHHTRNILRKTPSFRRKNTVALPRIEPEQLTITSLQKPIPLQAQFSLNHKDLKEKSILGKNLDVALIKFIEQLVSVEKIRDEFEIVYEVPFSSQRRFHLVIVRDKSSRSVSTNSSNSDDSLIRYTLMVKGAPEELILSCSTIATSNGEEKLDDDKMIEFEKSFLRFCNDGKSCIGFAMYEFDDFADTIFYMDPMESNFPDEGWCFLGMAALYDPVLPEVSAAVKAAEKADIRLFMISGDHPATAEALARKMEFDFGDYNVIESDLSTASVRSGTLENGISGGDFHEIELKGDSRSPSVLSLNSIRIDPMSNLEVIRGETVKELSKADWARLLSKKRVVFARTTPKQKMKIVRNCQLTGAVVTVTGDGVMDAPSLKQADVGLAMDAVGSIFAKEAADIVVVKPQLPNLINSIAKGRLLFDNLKKTIAYSLSHLVPEMFPVWFTFVFGMPLGMNSLQILTIDLLSELPPSIGLIFEPGERDLMSRPPRKKSSRLVTKALLFYSYCIAGMIISFGCILSYFTVFWSYGISTSDLLNTNHDFWKPLSPDLVLSSGRNLTAEKQIQVYYEASAAWHITLVVSQSLHLWTCTTRRISLLKHGIQNWTLLVAVIFELGTLFFVIFTPGVQNLLTVRPPQWYIWLYPIGVGITLFVFNETRKYFIRKNPKNPVVRALKW
ncbi:hypothetical protein FO519_002585 [Halicephalobus sp. NKZ332]|nr:hypothetical protein FO519_002585 [Halicephalobus sp. NKZ332]